MFVIGKISRFPVNGERGSGEISSILFVTRLSKKGDIKENYRVTTDPITLEKPKPTGWTRNWKTESAALIALDLMKNRGYDDYEVISY